MADYIKNPKTGKKARLSSARNESGVWGNTEDDKPKKVVKPNTVRLEGKTAKAPAAPPFKLTKPEKPKVEQKRTPVGRPGTVGGRLIEAGSKAVREAKVTEVASGSDNIEDSTGLRPMPSGKVKRTRKVKAPNESINDAGYKNPLKPADVALGKNHPMFTAPTAEGRISAWQGAHAHLDSREVYTPPSAKPSAKNPKASRERAEAVDEHTSIRDKFIQLSTGANSARHGAAREALRAAHGAHMEKHGIIRGAENICQTPGCSRLNEGAKSCGDAGGSCNVSGPNVQR